MDEIPETYDNDWNLNFENKTYILSNYQEFEDNEKYICKDNNLYYVNSESLSYELLFAGNSNRKQYISKTIQIKRKN